MSKNFELLKRTQDSYKVLDVPGVEVPPLTLDYRPARAAADVSGGESMAGSVWRVVRERRWLIGIFTLAVVVLVTIGSLLMTPKYDASSAVIFYRETSSNDVLGLKDVAGNSGSSDPDDHATVQTQIGILKSDSLAAQVIRDLQLNANPEFTGKLKPGAGQPRPEDLVGKIRDGLDIKEQKGTRLIEIHFRSTNPKLAADVANAFSHAYVEQNYKSRYQRTMEISGWLAQQLSEVQQNVQTSQQKLVDYQKQNGFIGLDDKQNIVTSKLDDLNKNLTVAEGDRIQKEAAYRLSRSSNPDLIGKAEPESLMGKLQARRAELQNQYAQTSVQYGPNHPKVLELKSQLKQADETVAKETANQGDRYKNEYLAALQRERMLRAEFEQQKQAANSLNSRAIEYNLLKRDVDSNRQLYEGLLQKLKEAGVIAGLKSSNIRIVDSAQVPAKPAEPNLPRNIALALLLGMVGGTGLAYIADRFDNRVSTPEQIEKMSSLNTLGLVPLIEASPSDGKLALSAPRGEMLRSSPEIAESYRAVLTSVLLSSRVAPQVIMVTSAMAGEGKTMTSVNSAILLARQRRRVLLLDTDLRRPNVHRALGVRPVTGLGDVLRREVTLEQAIVPSTHCRDLFILPAGPVKLPDDCELLVSMFRQVLDSCRSQFDHIIVDTPPTLEVSDTVRLSVEADTVLLVVRSGQTTKDALLRAQQLLAKVNAKVAGVVVNAADMQSPAFSSYTGYGYTYKSDYGNKRSDIA